MNVDHPSRGRLKKRWMNCAKDEMRIKEMSMEMTSNRRKWKKITCTTKWDKWMMMMSV
jgi:hypothetical protein